MLYLAHAPRIGSVIELLAARDRSRQASDKEARKVRQHSSFHHMLELVITCCRKAHEFYCFAQHCATIIGSVV